MKLLINTYTCIIIMVFNFNVHAVALMNPDKMHICLSIKLFFQIVIMALFSISEFIISKISKQLFKFRIKKKEF